MNTADDRSTRRSLVDGLLDTANHTAWQRFCEKYQPLLKAACGRFHVQPSDVDDVVANVLLKVAERMHNGWAYDPSKSFRGWLTTICYNESMRHLRQASGLAARGAVGVFAGQDQAVIPLEPES